MTREEAIKELKCYHREDGSVPEELTMAISALETDGDAISRRAAIDAVRAYATIWMEYTHDMTPDEIAQEALNSAKATMIQICEELPSAQPRTKCIAEIKISKEDLDELVAEKVEEIKAAQTEQRWIPCSERVPETEDKVLCQTVTKKGISNFVIGYYMKESNYWACGMNSNVIAWMPLPEPYKEEQP